MKEREGGVKERAWGEEEGWGEGERLEIRRQLK